MANDVLKFSDKILPVQAEWRREYKGTEEAYYKDLYNLIVSSSDIQTPYEMFDLATSDLFTLEEMGANPIVLKFMQTIIRLANCKSVLEIGTFIGVSAMTMAAALPNDGKLTTIEKFDRFAAVAAENFEKNNFGDKIQLINQDAQEYLSELNESVIFDLVFLDGNKEKYGPYFYLIDPLLKPGGILMVDDVLFHGDVLNEPPVSKKGEGVRRFVDMKSAMANYHRLLLPIANGLMILQKYK